MLHCPGQGQGFDGANGLTKLATRLTITAEKWDYTKNRGR
jgi:hypothetical protein